MAEPLRGLPEPGPDGTLRDAKGRGDLAVVVTVHVPKDDGRRKLGRKRAQGVEQIRPQRVVGRIGRRGGPPEAAQDLAHRPELRRSPVRDRSVDRDPVDPRFGRCFRPPAAPGVEGLHESVLRAILSRRRIAEQRRQRPVHPRIRHPVQAVEILSRARAEVVRHPEVNNASGYSFVPIVWTQDPAP